MNYTAPARVNPIITHPEERRLALDGQWRFRLDPDDLGLAAQWFAHDEAIADPIRVPGCWQGQGFGGDGNDTVWDFRLETRTLRATYTGTGWYAHAFRPLDAWRDCRLWLNFGGVHPGCEVWVNGVRVGENNLPLAPFGLEITEQVRFDADNTVVVRVHEAFRELGLAYNWQGHWSGLYRGVDLRATGPSHIRFFGGCPDVDGELIRITAHICPGGCRVNESLVEVTPLTHAGPPVTAEETVSGEQHTLDLAVPSPELWRPESPHLYQVNFALLADGQVSDAYSVRVGFVKLSTRGKQFCINDEPYYMRGTGDFLSCPETGCPDTDRDRWRRKLRALRDYGYNYVRCQSYVYGPEYYDAADELGLLVQSEMGMLGGWGGHNQWHVYQWPPPTPAFRELLRSQWNYIVQRDASNPSANLYCMSNELGANTLFPRVARRCERETKATKPSAMVIWTDGGLNESLPQDFVNVEASKDNDSALPLIQHEFRWWSSFPDVRIEGKYSGAMRPYAAQIAREAAAHHGIAHVLERAAEASQRLQFVEAKAKMEACRRDSPTLAGICHFNAMDANPSPQGIIDEFYERKYADAATWQQTNGDTVVLCSLGFDDRVLTAGETLRCDFSVSDFSHPPLQPGELEWELACPDAPLANGRIALQSTPFRTCPAGEIEVRIPSVSRPTRAWLEARIGDGERTVKNRWDLWLFPNAVSLPEGLALGGIPEHTWLQTLPDLPKPAPPLADARAVLTERLTPDLVDYMRQGGRVILAASEGLTRPFNPKLGSALGRYFFTPPANYPPYEDGHDGVTVNPHRMLGDLPHEGFADLQFFRVIASAPPLDLEPLGLTHAEPVIRVMHSYPAGRSLGYLIEGSVGDATPGRLIVCALQLDQSWPEARCVLAALCRYAVGTLPPAPAVSDEAIEALVGGTDLP